MINSLITLLIYCIVLGVVVWLINYLVATLPIADPFGRIIRIATMVIAVLIVILLLLSLVDSGPVRLPRL